MIWGLVKTVMSELWMSFSVRLLAFFLLLVKRLLLHPVLMSNNQRKCKVDSPYTFPFFSFFNKQKLLFQSLTKLPLAFVWLQANQSNSQGRMELAFCLDQSLFIAWFIPWGKNRGFRHWLYSISGENQHFYRKE